MYGDCDVIGQADVPTWQANPNHCPPSLQTGLLHDQVTVSVTRPDWPVWS
jgi:hypothetical protein